MKEDNDKLADFIRNKMNDFVETQDDWDRPDPALWKDTQAQLGSPNSSFPHAFPLWRYALGAVTLLALIVGTIWYLSNKNAHLEIQLQEQSIEIAQLMEVIQTQTEQQTIITDKNQFKTAQLLQEIELDKVEKEALYQKNKGLIRSVKQLEKDLRIVQKAYTAVVNSKESVDENGSIAMDGKTPISINSKKSSQTINEDSHIMNQLKNQPIFANSILVSEPPLLNNLEVAIRPMQRPASFEIGLNFGQMVLNTSAGNYVNEIEKKRLESQKVSVFSTEVHIAYQIKKNWWLKSGLRMGNNTTENRYTFEFNYDKSKERPGPNGTLVNDVSLNIQNRLFPSTQNLTIGVTDSPELDTGDKLFGDIIEKQNTSVFQFPLLIEYRRNSQRLDWQVGLGALFTRLAYEVDPIAAEIYSAEKNFQTKLFNRRFNNSTVKSLVGVQGNIGLHYQINPHLMIRADVLFQYHPYLSGQNYQVGISYQL